MPKLNDLYKGNELGQEEELENLSFLDQENNQEIENDLAILEPRQNIAEELDAELGSLRTRIQADVADEDRDWETKIF